MPLFIYVDNIEKNINIIKKTTNKEIMAVVKSNAYGLDSRKIIPILKKQNINFFVFEKYKEYKKCKDILINNKVLILESCNSYDNNDSIRYSINSLIDAYNIKNIKHKINVHLRVDTGMNRLGLRGINELKKAIAVLETNELINIEGIFTHFSSDEFESNYFEKQLNEFKNMIKTKNYQIIHANATKNLHKEIVGNYVRVGIALYGYHNPYIKLLRTVSLNTKPINVFKTNKKTKLGYNQTSSYNETIGVLEYGYNDLDFSNLHYIYKKNKKYKLISKSCMNHTHFYADDKINYLSWLSILPTNGIIRDSKDYNYNINWYHLLTSMKDVPKNYIRRSNYDIPKILKYNGQKSLKCGIRKRSS